MLLCMHTAGSMTHRCCLEEGLQRSVAVEVKSMATDAGRAKFVQLLRYSTNMSLPDRSCMQGLSARTVQSLYICSMMLICLLEC